jgi:signal transduction histidine kinase
MTLGIVAGICLGFGILYLFVGLRRKNDKRLNLTFALFALGYAGTLVNGIRFHSATSVAEYVAVSRWDAVFVVLAFSALIWYVGYYTGVRPRIFLWAVTAVYATSGIANIVRPNLIFGEILGLAYVTLPWGEQLAYIETTDSIWSLLFLLAQLTTLGFIVVACVLQFRRGGRQAAILLGIGMLWFITMLAAELIGEAGLIGYAPYGEIGFLGLAVVVSLQMANSVIRTEEELAQYRQNLEALVDARTAELNTVNENLAQEIAERTHTEEALRSRVEELAVLNRIAHTLATTADLSTALERVSETMAYLFDALYTHILFPEDEAGQNTIWTGFEREAGPVNMATVDIPLSELPLVRQVLNQSQPMAVSDVQSHPLIPSVRDYLSDRNVQSLLLLPLLVRGAAVGLVAVASDQADRDFSTDEIELVETIAGDVAAAVENARLLERVKVAAAAEERNRIARELHDSVTQTLYSVSIVAEALPRLLERDLAEAKRSTAYLRQTTLGALAEMRALLFELRPDSLAKAGLDVLLHQLADVLTGRTRLPVEVSVDGKATLPTDVQIALYRIAQEAFNNIARHAKASRAWATLQTGLDGAILVIRDNGQGFDPRSIPPEHMGTRIMRERADAIGAVLTIESRPGQGTQITAKWTNDEGPRTEDQR